MKMSEIILDFAQPLLEHAPDDEGYKSALSIAILTWNLTLLPEKEKKKTEKKMINELGQTLSGKKILKNVIQELTKRKIEPFSHINRMITDYHLDCTGDSYHFNVISTLLNVPNPEKEQTSLF